MENSTTAYILDKEDRILSVSGPWDQFAYQNDGVNARASDVCGRSIWDFIVGDEARMWLNAIFQIARVRNANVERPYRCDSPEVKRFMRMRIVPCEGGALRIEHEVLGMEERSIPVYIRYGPSKDMENIRIRCSFCGHMKHGEAWEEPRAEHAGPSREIIVAYSVCEDCRRSMPARIRKIPHQG